MQKNGMLLGIYKGILHPFGKTKTYKPIRITEDEIATLHFLGYEDGLDENFIKQQLSTVRNASTEIDNISLATTIADTQSSQDDEIACELANDLFYKFRNQT